MVVGEVMEHGVLLVGKGGRRTRRNERRLREWYKGRGEGRRTNLANKNYGVEELRSRRILSTLTTME